MSAKEKAIKAAARALVMSSPSQSVQYDDMPQYRQDAWDIRANAALTAAAPFTDAQAKAEALREAAEYHAEHIGLYSDWGDIQDRKAKKDYESTADWLRARAATTESEAS